MDKAYVRNKILICYIQQKGDVSFKGKQKQQNKKRKISRLCTCNFLTSLKTADFYRRFYYFYLLINANIVF